MKNKLFVFPLIVAAFIFFGTARAQSIPPLTAPTGISANVLPSGQIYVSWGSSSAPNLAGYYLYRNGQEIANIPGYTFFTDAPAAGSYSYTVAAYDISGNISPQSMATPFVTVVPDTVAPTAPTGLTATVSSSSVTLSWQPSTDNVAVIGYYVLRDDTRIKTINPITGTTYTDTGLTTAATYTYTVVAYDAVGNLSNGPSIQATTLFDITPPTVPQNPVAALASPISINLTWQPSTDNVQVVGYNIYRDGSILTTVPGNASTSYLDSGLSYQTTYYYNISAYDELGNTSAQSREVLATTGTQDLTPPTVPKYFSANAISASSVILAWIPSTDNVAVDGYTIYRDGSQIATTASTSYIDSGLTTSTLYEYAMTAYDTSNNISPQVSAAVTTLANNPVAPVVPVAPVIPTVPPPVVVPLPAQPPVVPVSPPPIVMPPPVSPPTTITLTANLSYGSRSTQVTALQNFLIQNNDLGSAYATGFYGSLTQAAVRQFQCAQNIICSGSPATTGWGSVGPRTRAAINSF